MAEKTYTIEEAKAKWHKTIRKQAGELEDMLKKSQKQMQHV